MLPPMRTLLLITALCFAACTKPVSAPMPDLPAPVTAPADALVADTPKPDMGAAIDSTGTTGAMAPDAAPIFPASPTAIVVTVSAAK